MAVDFKLLAENLLILGQHTALARRYLRIRGRARVLRRYQKAAVTTLRESNPLVGIGFTAPLSLAGQPSVLIVRGERLAMEGIPVALDFDSGGRHSGTPLAEVVEKLRDATGKDWADGWVIELYRRFMLDDDRLVTVDTRHAIQRIPAHLNRLRIQRRHLEKQLADAVVGQQVERFAVLVRKNDLLEVLSKIPKTTDMSVLVAFHPHSGCTVSGKAVQTHWGQGSGLAIVWRQDLARLLTKAKKVVTIQAMAGEWLGWIDRTPEAFVYGNTPPLRFSYFGMERTSA